MIIIMGYFNFYSEVYLNIFGLVVGKFGIKRFY